MRPSSSRLRNAHSSALNSLKARDSSAAGWLKAVGGGVSTPNAPYCERWVGRVARAAPRLC